jgi:glycine C-acetyltransferase
LKRLELLRSNPELKDNLWKIVNALQTGLKDAGFEIGKTQSPVTPVYMSAALAKLPTSFMIFVRITTSSVPWSYTLWYLKASSS